jgi:hypothetical protein
VQPVVVTAQQLVECIPVASAGCAHQGDVVGSDGADRTARVRVRT